MIEYLGHKIQWVPELIKSDQPIYLQIVACLESDISTGKLPTGAKLPPQRVIANYLGINHSTVTKAYKHCEDKGLIKGIVGKGTYVSNTSGVPKTVLSDPNFEYIELDMLHPLYETNDLLAQMVAELSMHCDQDIMYKYSVASGDMKHKYIASKWLEKINIYAKPDRMMITAGAQNALLTVLMSRFKRGDRVAVDELTYTGIINLGQQLGLELITIKSDEGGMIAEDFKSKILKYHIKGVYLIPDCHNPTTITMALSRRQEVAKVVSDHNLIAIEDSVFRFTNHVTLPTLYSLLPNHCFHIASVSKMINPGFRVAYLLLPDTVKYEKLDHVLHNIIFMPSSITAEMVSCLQSSQKLDVLLDRRREILRARNDIYDKIFNIKRQDVNMPMYRFLPLPRAYATDIETQLQGFEIRAYSADRFRVCENKGAYGIRVSLCALESEEALEAALNKLKEALNKMMKGGLKDEEI